MIKLFLALESAVLTYERMQMLDIRCKPDIDYRSKLEVCREAVYLPPSDIMVSYFERLLADILGRCNDMVSCMSDTLTDEEVQHQIDSVPVK